MSLLSSIGPWFDSQNPHCGSQPLVITDPAELMILCPLHTSVGSRNVHGAQTYKQAKPSHTQNKINKTKMNKQETQATEEYNKRRGKPNLKSILALFYQCVCFP
ncbi:hypothetical protein LEMLEM_LOCUS1004 [Lemmus lemmus]